MSSSAFDAIIDDCFLDGAAKSISRKYQDKTNVRAIQIIDEILSQEGSNNNSA